MSIQSEINRIAGNVSDAYDAAGELGATVPQARTSAGLAQTIRGIPSGSGAVNLLDNADWGYTLVNQRGITSVTVSSGTWDSTIGGDYTIDRWITCGRITVTKPTVSAVGYITLDAGCVMKQRMEILPPALIGKTITAAVDIGGTVYSDTVAFPANGEETVFSDGGVTVAVGIDSGTYKLSGVSAAGVPYVKITASSAVNVRRVWLELGSVCHMETTPPRSYAESFSVCRRYLMPITRGATFTALVQSNTKQIDVYIPQKFRILPQFDSDSVNINAFRADGVKPNVSCTITNVFESTPFVVYALTSETDMSTATYRAMSAYFLERHLLTAEL